MSVYKLKYFIIYNENDRLKLIIINTKPACRKWIIANKDKNFKLIKGQEIEAKVIEVAKISIA